MAQQDYGSTETEHLHWEVKVHSLWCLPEGIAGKGNSLEVSVPTVE